MARPKHQVEPADLRHLPRMLETHRRAFSADPMFGYIFTKGDQASIARSMLLALCQKLFIVVITAYFMVCRDNYQIGGGVAYITWNPASEFSPPPDWLYMFIMNFFQRLKTILCTPEQQRRDAEYGTKLAEARTSVLGEGSHELICLNVLAADPVVQGRGYGLSLLTLLCAMADDQNRKVWLTSTNTNNTRFYEASGFITVRDIVLGQDNPVHKANPVVIKFMVREPRRRD
ncbi:unnamed protein product [Peniophora sp. CBMAI 1063]|nr:unnamed protein product [Peniophora sp. CBMAI 1063]